MQLWKKLFISTISICTSLRLSAQTDNYQLRVNNYIATYKEWAMLEQRRTGIPAAITLAQGIHETTAGTSELATQANNHFGIKCKKEWTGETYAHTDDAPNECFRKYAKAYDSYLDHSDYLKNSPRYNSLFRLSVTDYASWATGLKRCGYATNPRYAQVLIKLIEDYHLQDYTYAALNDNVNPLKTDAVEVATTAKEAPAPIHTNTSEEDILPAPPQTVNGAAKKSNIKVDSEDLPAGEQAIANTAKPPYGEVVRVNGLRAFYARKGSSLLNDALKYNMRYARLLEINELPDAPLDADMFIYLEKKHMKGNTSFHVLKPGETLLQASQYEGMQVKYIRYYNKLSDQEEPVAGSLLYLQDMADQKPEVEKRTLEKPVLTASNSFAGDHPGAIPQGATRMKTGYLSKAEIEKAQTDKTIEKAKPVIARKEEAPAIATATTKAEKQEIPEEFQPEPVKKVVAEKPAEPVVAEVKAPQPEVVKTTPAIEKPVEQEKKEEIRPVAEVKKPLEETTPTPEIAKPVVSESKKEEVPPVAEVPKTEEPKHETIAVKEPVVMPVIPDEKPVEEVKQPEPVEVPVAKASPAPVPKPEEPKDEFDRLKAKLDKVVYASDNISTTASTPQVENAKEQPKPKPGSAKASGFVGLYTVKKGDTAFSIAKKNHISMKQLMEWNNLDFKEIKEGQQLRVK